jgi:uncharacterized membrane-anchored protein
MKRIGLVLFLAVVFCQLAVPAYLIWREEETLSGGQLFKFKTAPVDPVDAFRGRYVALQYDAAVTDAPPGFDFPESYGGERSVFVQVETGADGFARVSRISNERPEAGAYFKAEAGRNWSSSEKEHQVRLNFPFDAYYMEETEAPRAETVYRENSPRRHIVNSISTANNPASNKTPTTPEHVTYAAVRILNGHASLEELYFDDLSAHEYLKQHPEAR